jgi:hypothetical protein
LKIATTTPIHSSRISAVPHSTDSYPLSDHSRKKFTDERRTRAAFTPQSDPPTPSALRKAEGRLLQSDSTTVSPINSYRTFQSPTRPRPDEHVVVPLARTQSRSLAASVKARQHEFLETVCSRSLILYCIFFSLLTL